MVSWKPIDFEGITALDKSLYEQLDQFLYEKEGLLGECIVHSIQGSSKEPHLPSKSIFHLKLSEALEQFEKKIRQVGLNHNFVPTIKDFHTTVSLINAGLWQYVETLEGCVVELFQQLDSLGLEKWNQDMLSTVNTIKIMLMHRMEDVSWAVQRLESLLWKYRGLCKREGSYWENLKSWLPWTHLLDRGLLINLEKSKKFLGFRHKKFIDRMEDFKNFSEKIDQHVQKFQNYNMYQSLDSIDKDNFRRVYELLKLWELNQSSQSLPAFEVIKALRRVQGDERIFHVFKDYFLALKEILFSQARLFKLGPKTLWEDFSGKSLALDVLSGYRSEISTLGATVSNYRNFLLRTDPNPYVRSRWGFAEWIVGPEPAETKRLLDLGYEIESLDSLFEKLQESLKKGPSSENEELKLKQSAQFIEQWLHECSQPLTSRGIMHTKMEHIMSALVELDELGSFNKNVIDFVGQILSKSLRADWKYNTAFEIPKFQEIYQIHIGLIGRSEDRQHYNRKNKFKQIIQQIESWLKKKNTQKHIHEIEQDMSDIKILLQDFLAFVQRMTAGSSIDIKKDKIQKEIVRQLLEYRYLFGHFFHQISQEETEGRLLRNQFLFVYQYFEAVENKLQS